LDFVVTRAPFRISFAGGGTDLPSFYQRDYGAVLSTTIDKYVYVMINKCRPVLSRGVDDPGRYRIRFSYASTENVQSADELRHPIAREALKLLGLDIPMDISTMADVPAGTGLGSSASFAVALLHALHLIKGDKVTREQLAAEAARVEIDLLGRPVGKQDHYAAAFGGLNMIHFHASQEVSVRPVGSLDLVQRRLFPYLMLLYTGVSRDASKVLSEQQQNINGKYADLMTMRGHAHQLEKMVEGELSVRSFAEVLHATWMRKRDLASGISNTRIDRWYDRGREAGALGGKICGAGGGGFLLLVVEPENRAAVRRALQELPDLPINYEPQGSQALLPPGQPVLVGHGGTA
jgi:D-glycero-alpha-D-manno-heptose-7-phosphate kinase